MNWRLALAILEVLHACAMLADAGEFTPTLAAGGGYAAVATPAPVDPDIGNICPDCNGKGWVGDGTIRNKCTACDGTGKRTKTASVDAPRPEQQPPEVSDPHHGASTSAPTAAGEHEAPSFEFPTPAIQPTYDAACQEATRTRELLVVTYDNEEHRAAALKWLHRTAAAKRFVWLLQSGEKTSVHIHNVVTQESRRVTQTQDLKE